MRIVPLLILGLCLGITASPPAAGGEAGRYMTTAEFLDGAFPAGPPTSSTLWVDGEIRKSIESVLGHRFSPLRIRYWQREATSAWVLDEIGKELPITIGVTVTNGSIAQVRILEFRETRGWEVRYPFFTDQFREAGLSADGRLDRDIDGISGATLSVRAVKRIARIALLLHETTAQKG
jgi:hypothetical protein